MKVGIVYNIATLTLLKKSNNDVYFLTNWELGMGQVIDSTQVPQLIPGEIHFAKSN